MNISQKIGRAALAGSVLGSLLIANVAFAAEIGVGINASAAVGGPRGGVEERGNTAVNAGAQGSGQTKNTDTRPPMASTTRMMGQTNAANVQIRNRIDALQKLLQRIGSMVKVTADQKTNFQTEIQNEITLLTTFQSTIASATSTAAIRGDRQSITGDYRIYALVMPQISLLAAIDRTQNLVTMMTTLGTKLQNRIASSTTSVDASVLADFSAKVADAKVQAAAAQSEIVSLKPDQGNQTQMQANMTALKDARAKVQVAAQDLAAARADATKILKGLGVSVSAAANTSVQTSSQ